MKIIITGGAGFIGCNLIFKLLSRRDQDLQILNLDKLTYAGNLESLKPIDSDPRYSFLKLDIVDRHAVENAVNEFQPDWIFHLAAESHVDRSIAGPETFVETNVVGTLNLLQASRIHLASLNQLAKNRFRFLHVSTDEVYGSLDADQEPFSEMARYNPRSPYAASKASSDHLARSWRNTYQLPVLITSCSNNYGPYQHPEKLIPVVILAAIQGRPIPIYGSGDHQRDWLYVDDHVEAMIAVMEQGEVGETYNIAANNVLRNIDLVKSICSMLDQLVPIGNNPLISNEIRDSKLEKYEQLIRFVEDRPGHDFCYSLNTTKILEQLHWMPNTMPDEGLSKTVKWYLENQDWWKAVESRNPRIGNADQNFNNK